MATLGRITIGATPRAINDAAKGLRVTFPVAAAAGFSCFAYLADTVAGDAYQMVLVSDADKTTVLAYSAIRTDIQAAGWYEFTGGTFASYAPANGLVCLVAVLGDGAANGTVNQDDAGLEGYERPGVTTGTPPTISGAMGADTSRDYSVYVDYDAASADPPDVTDVDTDEIITSTQQNIALTGTDLGTIDEIRVYDQDDVLYLVANVDSSDDDDAIFDMPADALLGGATGIRYGDAAVRYLRDDAESDDHAVTIIPPAGRSYVDLTSLATSGLRITAVADLAVGDQIEASNIQGTGNVHLMPSGKFWCDAGVTAFDARAHNQVDGWGAVGTQTLPADVPPTIITTSLPDAPKGVAYSQFVLAAGDPTIGFAVQSGALPTWATLDTVTGEIYGNPSGTPGVANFTIRGTNAFSFDDQALSIETLPQAPSILTDPLPPAFVGIFYSYQIQSTGDGPFAVTLPIGALPDGLSLSATGLVSGTPTQVELQNFTVQFDNDGGSDTQEYTMSVTVDVGSAGFGFDFDFNF